MSTAELTIEQIVNLAKTLKPLERAQLIARLKTLLESSPVKSEQVPITSRRSLRGMLADLGSAPPAEEIDEARREMWGNFPREDFR